MLEESPSARPLLRLGGEFFPTLCVAPLLPLPEQPSLAGARDALGALIRTQQNTETMLRHSDSALALAQQAAALREHFIAVLGHDLRNSLQSISFGTEQLRQSVTDARSVEVVQRIERSCGRMTELIQNVLDFTRGRLGGGIPLQLQNDDALGDELRHVIAEVQSAHAGREIDVVIDLAVPVFCDRRRIAQLLANLLSNAVTHGAPEQRVEVRIRSDAAGFEITVGNGGACIAAERLAGLFEPFSHGVEDAAKPGLGLGLYIATQIAKAHAGTLSVTSTDDDTCFTFRMPPR